MAYTRPWDPSLPDGDVLDAADIDGEFRRLKEDFEERLEDTLFVDMTADPLVLKDSFNFNKSKRRNIDANKFRFDIAPINPTDVYLEFQSASIITGYADVELPDAVELTGMLPYYQRVEGGLGTASGNVKLLAINHGSGAVTTLADSGALTSTTALSNPLTNFSHTIDLGNYWYKLKVVISGASADFWRFSMVTLLYTSPNAGATL